MRTNRISAHLVRRSHGLASCASSRILWVRSSWTAVSICRQTSEVDLSVRSVVRTGGPRSKESQDPRRIAVDIVRRSKGAEAEWLAPAQTAVLGETVAATDEPFNSASSSFQQNDRRRDTLYDEGSVMAFSTYEGTTSTDRTSESGVIDAK